MWIMLFVLIGCAVVDLRTRRIPNGVTYGLIPFGMGVGIFRMGAKGMVAGLLLACLVGVFLSLLHAVGGADIKIGAALGAAYGTTGFLYGMGYAILIAGITGVVLLVKQLRHKKDDFWGLQCAFVPYMALGFAIVTVQR